VADGSDLEDLAALLDEVEALVAGEEPSGSSRERQELVVGYLDALLSHRGAVALLYRDSELLRDTVLGRRVTELDRALHDRVIGRESDLEESIRSAVALRGALAAVATEPEVDEGTVRELGVRMSLAALDGHGRR
jgi:hypothetical protein